MWERVRRRGGGGGKESRLNQNLAFIEHLLYFIGNMAISQTVHQRLKDFALFLREVERQQAPPESEMAYQLPPRPPSWAALEPHCLRALITLHLV